MENKEKKMDDFLKEKLKIKQIQRDTRFKGTLHQYG